MHEYRFHNSIIANYLSKLANVYLPQLHLVPLLGMTPFKVRKDFLDQKLLVAIVRRCLHIPTFSHFSRTPTCVRQTDRHIQTQTQSHSIYRAKQTSREKNPNSSEFKFCRARRREFKSHRPSRRFCLGLCESCLRLLLMHSHSQQ